LKPKTVVITQSNYIPWRGYFDMLRSADEVILLDSVQYTRRDWRNRNRIKTAGGLAWLSIPVEAKGRFEQAIDETRIADNDWAARHLRSIELAYRRAPHFSAVFPWLSGVLSEIGSEPLLSSVNRHLLRAISHRLGITVRILCCSDVLERGALCGMIASERLAVLAAARGATRYLSGPAAKDYLNVDLFSSRGIEVVWMDYQGYPDYPQLWGPFEPFVSVVDLLLNTGDEALQYLTRHAP
jgi:hypothetical protein